MKIEVQLHDGTILEFPEGTSDAVIDRAVRQQLGRATPMDAVGEVNRMVGDTVQLVERVRQPFGPSRGNVANADTLAGGSVSSGGERYRPSTPADRAALRTRQSEDLRYQLDTIEQRPGENDLQFESRRQSLDRQVNAPLADPNRRSAYDNASDETRHLIDWVSGSARATPEQYPFLFRQGRRLNSEEIIDMVLSNQEGIEGRDREEAATILFGTAEDRRALDRNADEARALGMVSNNQPRFQRDPRTRDEVNPTDTNARGWEDHLDTQYTPEQARIRQQRERNALASWHRENEIQPETTLGRLSALFGRGYQRFGAGLNRFLAPVLDTIGLEDAAERQTRIAQAFEAASSRRIRGQTTWEDVKEDPLGNVAGFILDTGIESSVDMFAAVALTPALVARYAGSIGQERAQNSGRTNADLRDLANSILPALGMSLLERYGARAAISAVPGETAGRHIIRATVAEGVLTEPWQELLEYTASVVGTNKPFDGLEALDRMGAGLVAGSGMGAGLAAGSEAASATTASIEERFFSQARAYRDFAQADQFGPQAIDDAARRAMERPDSPRILNPLPPREDGRPRLPGIREAAVAATPPPSPADERSPLDTSLLDEGRRIMGEATASNRADELLSANGAPTTGRRVTVNYGDRVINGVVIDGFESDDKELGSAAGIRIRLADGTIFDEYFDTIRNSGISIAEAAPPPRPASPPSDVGAGPRANPTRRSGELRAPDDILRSLGTQHTPNGARRSQQQNTRVGGARRSDHLTDNARDIPLQRGMTKERLREAFEAEGYFVRIVLGPGDRGHHDHFHISYYPPGDPRIPQGRRGAGSAAPARAAPGRSSGDPITDYMAMTRAAESGGNDSAANPRSSARGRYQFLDGTWNNYARPGERRGDPVAEERIMRAFTEENAERLRGANIPISPAALYQAHHFGAGGAISMHRNPDGALSADVVRANPHLRGKTNREALEWASSYLASRNPGGATSGGATGPLPETPEVEALPPLADLGIDNPMAATARPNAPANLGESSQPVGGVQTDLLGGPDVRAAELDARREVPALIERVREDSRIVADIQEAALDVLRPGQDEDYTRYNAAQLSSAAGITISAAEAPDFARTILRELGVSPERLDGDTAAADPVPQFEPGAGPATIQLTEPGQSVSFQPTAAPDVGSVPPLPSIEPTASGKGLTITGATGEQMASIRAALPERVSIVPNKDGALVISRKHEEAVRTALTGTSGAPSPGVAPAAPSQAAGADISAPLGQSATVQPGETERDDYRMDAFAVTESRATGSQSERLAFSKGAADALDYAARVNFDRVDLSIPAQATAYQKGQQAARRELGRRGLPIPASATRSAPTKQDQLKAKIAAKGGVRVLRDWSGTMIPNPADAQRVDGDGGATKDEFLTDAQAFAKAVEAILKSEGFLPPLDGKNKPVKAVSVNKAGPGSSGDVSLRLYRADDTGVFMQIGTTLATPSGGISIMARKAHRTNDQFGTRSTNQWLPVNMSAQDMAQRLSQIAGTESQSSSRPDEAAGASVPGRPRVFVNVVGPDGMTDAERAAQTTQDNQIATDVAVAPRERARQLAIEVAREGNPTTGFNARGSYSFGQKVNPLQPGPQMRPGKVSVELDDNRGTVHEFTQAEILAAAKADAPKAPKADADTFNRVWNDRAFKAAMKALDESVPNRESPVAADAVRGWIDGQNRDVAALDAHSDATADQVIRTTRPNGLNPRDSYLEAFYAAATGKTRQIRMRGIGNTLGHGPAIDEIAAAIGAPAPEAAGKGVTPEAKANQVADAGKPIASANTIFTEDAYEAAKRRMKERMNRANAGVDPELLLDGIVMAGFHVERGARTFAAYAEAMIADLGRDIIPNLRSFYEAVRYDPRASEFAAEMSSAEEIGAALARLEDQPGNGKKDSDATASEQAGARTDDRAGDEGPGAGDAPGPEGVGQFGEGDQGAGGQRGGDVRTGDERQVRDTPGGRRPAGEDQGSDSVAEPGERSRNRGRNRVPKRAGTGSNYLAPSGSLQRQGGWKATAERNLDIIQLVGTIEAEGRPATAEEQAQLVKFTGWGAGEIRNNLFRNIQRNQAGERVIPEAYYGDWKDLVNRARTLLTGPDLEAALQSVQYAHYTSEPVIRSIWSALDRLGFKGGRILEPGMGIGLFPIAAPADVMANSSYTGIELDAFTARIAKLLLPQENAIGADFVKQKLPNGFFDAAIGNPPFSATKVLDDPDYRKHRLSLHDFFFAKSIDKVRPGGLMVFVTSRYTMDKLNDEGRAYIADRADLIGAIRLPQTAFKENAGTEVVTDVLFFQRRAPDAQPGGQAWRGVEEVKAGKTKVLVNEYFARNPAMVLGTHATTGSMYRENEYTVEPPKSGDIASHFAKAVEGLPENIYTEATQRAAAEAKAATWEADMRPAAEKEGGLYVKDGAVLIRDQGVGKPAEVIYGKPLGADETAWLVDYAGLRDALKQAQRDQLRDGDWEASLKHLNTLYDAFVRKRGPISAFTEYERTTEDEDGTKTTTVYRRFKNEKLLRLDVEGLLVENLEKIGGDGKIAKGAFLLGRTLRRPQRPKIEGTTDALAVSLDEIGKLDLGYVARLAGKSREDVIQELGEGIFHVPGGDWQLADEYLSGDVLQKLDEARAAAAQDPDYERNVDALLKVQPKPLGPADITVKLGAGWVPLPVVQKFASEVLEVSADTLTYEPASASWSMDMKGTRAGRRAADEFGTSDRSPTELLVAILNNQTIKVTRTERVDGSTRTWTDQEATAAANEAAKSMTTRFRAWVWEDAKRAGELLDIYNRRFNNLAPRQFDGSHLTTPGLSENIRLYPHQKRAVWRLIQTGNVYLNHAVGAGKTLEMIVGGQEQRRLGLIEKPMYVVPNHMLNQFAREFLEAYPAANIMVADEKSFHTENRRRFMAQASLNAPDAIVITHSSFKKIGTSDESRKAVLDGMIVELEAAMKESDNKYTRSKIEKQIEGLKRAFEGKANRDKDTLLTFEELGVDYLFVDEAHLFRKLDFATSRSAKGIDPKGSQAAMDLFIKTRWLDQKSPGRSLALASGTPITNTMAEIFTVMRYMDLAGLERDGISAFDGWANMFGEVAPGYERNAAGGYELVERFSRFVNVPELMKRVRQFMDVLTSPDLGDIVKRPNVKGGVQNVITPQIDALAEYMHGELAARIERSKAWKPSKDQPVNPDPIIAINGDARLAIIDMRFINPDLESDPQSKLNEMIDRIITKQREIKDVAYVDPKTGSKQPTKGSTQIVFSALGFGEGAQINRGFDLRGWVDQRLLKSGAFKKSEIAWMGDANTHAKKEALFDAMRSGKVKVLFGSPANMGTGVNVQNRLKVLHYLSPPWYPADVEQPHGRIIRQGNWNEDVEILWYAAEGTYDSTQWSMVSRKAKFIEQAMRGDDSVRVLEDISEANQYEMASALAAGDSRVIEIASLASEIERLSRLEGAHFNDQRQMRQEKSSFEFEEKRLRESIASLENAVAARDATAPFAVTIGNSKFDKNKEAGEALLKAIAAAVDGLAATPTATIGKFQGHDIGIAPSRRRWGDDEGSAIQVTITVGGTTFDVGDAFGGVDGVDPVGFASRISNAMQRLPSMLRGEQQRLEQVRAELERLDRKIGAPFPQAQEMAEKIADRAQLQSQLAAETEAAEKARQARQKSGGPASVAEPRGPGYDGGDGTRSEQSADQPLRGDSDAVPARGGTVRALGIADEVSRERTAAFVGRTLEGPEQLAELAQVYRDPRYETFRVFFTKGTNIVHATGVSARLPGRAPLLPGPEGAVSMDRFVKWLNEGMESAGADGYYLLHNHPSGDPTPSRDDIAITKEVAQRVLGYRGHVIINSNRFAVIDRWGDTKTTERDFGEDLLLKPAKAHPVLGRKVGNVDELATIGKMLQTDGYVTVIATDAKLMVRAVVDYPASALSRPRTVLLGGLRGLMRRAGATDLFIVAPRSAIDTPAVRDGIFEGVITEAIDENGQPSRFPRSGRKSPLERADGAFVASPRATPDFADPAVEERWKEASKGVGNGPSVIARSKGWMAEVKNSFTRHWRHLPNIARFADLQQQFRKYEAASEAATEEIVRRLSRMVKGLDRTQFDLMNRKAVLDDLQWEAEVGHTLPFGFTPTTLAAEKAHIDALVDLPANSDVAEAIRYRKRVNGQLADEMIAAGVLTREQIKNPSYYRHMVLQYARAEMRQARSGDKKIKSPYWAKRMGSTLDINANLLEAEFDWMHKAMVDIATARLIDWVKSSDHNIRDELRTLAKNANRAKVKALVDADTQKAGAKTIRGPIAKQDLEFRQMMARGIATVQDELKHGNISGIPAHFQAAADSIEKGNRGGDPPFAFLAWIMDNQKPGANGAGMVLKAVGQRRAWERKLLDKEWVDPDDMDGLIKEYGRAGYTTWQPITGRHLFTARTIGESALDMFVGKLADTTIPGVNRDELARALGTIRNQLVVGGERYTMILPDEVATTLNEYGDARMQGLTENLFSTVQGWWKRWMLINPRRWFKYNLNNMTGDLDAIIAGNPGTFSKVPQAWRELMDVWVKKGVPSAEFRAAQDRGVFSAGMSVQEIPDIQKLSAFRQLSEAPSLRPDKLTIKAVAAIWNTLKGTTNFREALFRYAAYLDYAEKLQAGKTMKQIGYGASAPRMVDPVKGIEDKAALLARDLVGDYGAISVTGGFLRRFVMPFWSWTEINTRRYTRLIANAFRAGGGRGALSATAITAGLALRIGLVYGMISIWNALLFSDEEDELGDAQKRQLHLILGRDEEGEIVTLRLQGAFSDFIGLFGLPDAVAGVREWANGQGTLGDALGDMAKAPANRLFSGISPFYTVPFLELPTGKDYWPNLWEPRTIHDRWRHVASTFGVEHEYDGLVDNPTRGGGGWYGYGRSWSEAFVYRRDPGEMAYDTAKGMAYDWLERARGREGGGSFSSPTSDALRLYRMAIRYGDDDAANRALDQYEAAGGTARGFQQSVARQHPLGPIAKKDRQEYLESLTDEQYDVLLRAEEWYNRTFLQQLNDNERSAAEEPTLEAAE